MKLKPHDLSIALLYKSISLEFFHTKKNHKFYETTNLKKPNLFYLAMLHYNQFVKNKKNVAKNLNLCFYFIPLWFECRAIVIVLLKQFQKVQTYIQPFYLSPFTTEIHGTYIPYLMFFPKVVPKYCNRNIMTWNFNHDSSLNTNAVNM